MLGKVITALAFILCPVCTFLVIAAWQSPGEMKEGAFNGLLLVFGIGALSGAWLLARYLL